MLPVPQGVRRGQLALRVTDLRGVIRNFGVLGLDDGLRVVGRRGVFLDRDPNGMLFTPADGIDHDHRLQWLADGFSGQLWAERVDNDYQANTSLQHAAPCSQSTHLLCEVIC